MEYVTSISGRTDIPEVRCGVTDRHTDKPNYNNPHCACAPRVNKRTITDTTIYCYLNSPYVLRNASWSFFPPHTLFSIEVCTFVKRAWALRERFFSIHCSALRVLSVCAICPKSLSRICAEIRIVILLYTLCVRIFSRGKFICRVAASN